MQKVAIDDGERRVLVHQLQKVRAHRDQRGGAPRRVIDPPEELVTTRLGGVVDLARRRFVAIGLEFGDRVPHPVAIGPEIVGKSGEKHRMIARIERAITSDHLGGERDLRRLAPPFDQSAAVLDQLLDAFIRILRPRLDLQHRAPALGDGGQEIVEEGVAHGCPPAPAGAVIQDVGSRGAVGKSNSCSRFPCDAPSRAPISSRAVSHLSQLVQMAA